MWQLNLPDYYFRTKKNSDKVLIFDEFRKKWIVLTPEEWVRQNFLRYLVEELNYPFSYIALEKKLVIAGNTLRFDAVIYNKDGSILVLLEFKAPNIPVNDKVFDQANTYNTLLSAPFLMISNGIDHYFASKNDPKSPFLIQKNLPKFEIISNI